MSIHHRDIMEPRSTDSRLVAFLYLLLRDYLPAGTVEKLMMNATLPHFIETKLSNGAIAAYAEEIASSLKSTDHTLKSLLLALKQTSCWCEMGEGADFVKHTNACQNAQVYMRRHFE